MALLSSELHRGEAEAIALAIEMNADVVLIDERDGRIAARQAGLTLTGVLGVLLRAKTTGQITTVKPHIQALRTQARFFVSERLETEVLCSAGESLVNSSPTDQ